MEKTNFKQKILNLIFPFFVVIFLLILWSITAKVVDLDLLFPTIESVLTDLGNLFCQTSFYSAILNSLLRTLIAFALAFLFGVILSILSSAFSFLEKIFAPIITIMRSIPTMSILLLTLIWLDAFSSPVVLAFFVIFPIIYTNTLSAIKGIDGSLLDMAKLYHVNKRKIVMQLYIPSITKNIFASIRSTLSLTLKLIIAGEVFAQTSKSIGLNMYLGQIYLETAKIFAWTIVAIILGGLLEMVIIVFEKIVERNCYGN